MNDCGYILVNNKVVYFDLGWGWMYLLKLLVNIDFCFFDSNIIIFMIKVNKMN